MTERGQSNEDKQRDECTSTYRYLVPGTPHDAWYCRMFERKHLMMMLAGNLDLVEV